MNPSKSAQDVLRCHLCETPVPQLSCEVCHFYLCKGCVVDHILDESKKHSVVPINQTLSALLYPKCLEHSSRNCELYCEQCTIPICVHCVSSKDHKDHGFKDLLECVEGKKEILLKDLQELESSILNEQKEFASRIRNQKAILKNTLEEFKTVIDEHCEKLHRQLSDVVEKFKSEIVKKHAEKFAAMTETEERIELTISDIEKCILSVKELQTSRDLGRVFEYKSRNEEFRNAPLTKHNATLPTFVANEIKEDKLYELFGSLTMATDEITTGEQGVKSMSRKCHNRSTTHMRDLCQLECYLKSMQVELKFEKDRNEELLTRYNYLQKQNVQLQERNDGMQRNIRLLEIEIYKLRSSSPESKKLQEHNDQLQERNQQLQEHNQQLQEHNQQLQEHNQKLQAHNDQLQEHSDQLHEHN